MRWVKLGNSSRGRLPHALGGAVGSDEVGVLRPPDRGARARGGRTARRRSRGRSGRSRGARGGGSRRAGRAARASAGSGAAHRFPRARAASSRRRASAARVPRPKPAPPRGPHPVEGGAHLRVGDEGGHALFVLDRLAEAEGEAGRVRRPGQGRRRSTVRAAQWPAWRTCSPGRAPRPAAGGVPARPDEGGARLEQARAARSRPTSRRTNAAPSARPASRRQSRARQSRPEGSRARA